MKIKVTMLMLAGLFCAFSLITFAEAGSPANEGKVPGQPFQTLQQQIDELNEYVQLAPPDGTLVGPNLYHVHTRVLWDLSWLTNDSYLDGGFFTYWEEPKPLVYGPNRTLFLSPLEGYGIPEPPPGATRLVRLYVYYGHQWMCNGTPTVKIVSGDGEVEFSLPVIGGYYGDMGANWSDFRDLTEYEGIGHAQIQVYQKDFSWGGPHCGTYPGTGEDIAKGTIYRIEAHFYDQY
jgi:hypothetical protein